MAGVSSCVMRVIVLVLLLAIPQTAAAQQACTESLASLFERVSPSVVSIQVTKIHKAKPQRRFETNRGSRLAVEPEGQVVANRQTLARPSALCATLARRSAARPR